LPKEFVAFLLAEDLDVIFDPKSRYSLE